MSTHITSDMIRVALSGGGCDFITEHSADVDVATLTSILEEDGWKASSPIQEVLVYLSMSPQPKVPTVTGATELAPIVAALLGLTIGKPDSPEPETDATILARLERDGDYVFSLDTRLVCVPPRNGNLYHLERVHFHPRDAQILFEEDAHVYFLLSHEDGPTRFRGSVSSAYGKWFSHFDADDVVQKNIWRWLSNPDKEYHAIISALNNALILLGRDAKGKLPSVASTTMAQLWSITNSRERASEKGTAMHLALEQRCNGVPEDEVAPNLVFEGGDITLPAVQYRHFVDTVVDREGLKPYRTEWSVYDTDAVLSGQIDSLWVDPEGRFHMLDWKRCKNANLGPEEKHWGRYGSGPCASVPDTDYGHYGCQQALYAYILERNYGIKVASMRLVQFHPTALGNECRVVRVADSFRGVAEAIVKQRVDEMAACAVNPSKRIKT